MRQCNFMYYHATHFCYCKMLFHPIKKKKHVMGLILLLILSIFIHLRSDLSPNANALSPLMDYSFLDDH